MGLSRRHENEARQRQGVVRKEGRQGRRLNSKQLDGERSAVAPTGRSSSTALLRRQESEEVPQSCAASEIPKSARLRC